MSRRDGTFKIRQDKPIKNCGTTVITPRTKGDVPAAKTVRNVHTIEPSKPLFPKILNYTIPTENITEPLTYVEGKEWITPKIEDLSNTKGIESSPSLTYEEIDQIVNGPEIPFIEPDITAGKLIVNKVELPVSPISEYTKSVSDVKDVEPSPFTLISEEPRISSSSDSEQEKQLNETDVAPKKKGRKKRIVTEESVGLLPDVSNENTTLSPANNEDNKE